MKSESDEEDLNKTTYAITRLKLRKPRGHVTCMLQFCQLALLLARNTTLPNIQLNPCLRRSLDRAEGLEKEAVKGGGTIVVMPY